MAMALAIARIDTATPCDSDACLHTPVYYTIVSGKIKLKFTCFLYIILPMGTILASIISVILGFSAGIGANTAMTDTPDEAAAEFLDALAAGNMQVLQEYADNEYVDFLDDFDSDTAEEMEQAIFNGFSYEIIETAKKNGVAVAKVKVTTPDLSHVMKDFKKSSYDYISHHLYDKDVENKEKLSAKCKKIYAKQLKKESEDGTLENVVFIPMVANIDHSWDMKLSDGLTKTLMGSLKVPGDLREAAVDYLFDKDYIPAYSFDQVQAMDMSKPSGVTVADLKLVTRYKLVGTEEKLWQMEQDYNLNCLFLLGIASHESAYGTSQFHTNNVCGYGYSSYPSINDCLDIVGRVLAKNYLTPGAAYYKGTTIDAVNQTYAADPAWDTKVANKVTYFYEVISENHNKQLEKLK